MGSNEDQAKKKVGKSKIEKRKLSDKDEKQEEEEPIVKHIKVDEEISFDISMSSPQVPKKKSTVKGKSEIKPKLAKKNLANLKTKGTTEKPKKKIRKDKSRRTRMSGSNTRSTNVQL